MKAHEKEEAAGGSEAVEVQRRRTLYSILFWLEYKRRGKQSAEEPSDDLLLIA